MPTYVYKTDDGRYVETWQSIHEEPWDVAEIDGELVKVKRVPQAVPATFKGGGWAR